MFPYGNLLLLLGEVNGGTWDEIHEHESYPPGVHQV